MNFVLVSKEMQGKFVGKAIVITGATSGIGVETARALSTTGATLFLAACDLKKAETAPVGILELGRGSLHRAAATTTLAKSDNRVNTLAKNAACQVDVHSRVVIVVSPAYHARNLCESDKYHFQKGGYHYRLAFANCKLANVYMANELDRRYGRKWLNATILHTVSINTDLSRHLGSEFVGQNMSGKKILEILTTPEHGAAITVLAKVGREWGNKGGKHRESWEEEKGGEDDNEAFGVGYTRQIYDPKKEE
ncbi:uncharacterized protein BDR25DRAFT_328833 [Lindgomyces ingoldianus]|uniref:Uncharacterized protein n=1 Tax=Lindgomyces ingoldianus TaxID=673940 RepID=A0ACB6QF58_9PLEO|nr:uncharacterized protein BDR25DRAFT_328833 [Lindgomyces ingoldianus]KAF2464982.1 hypothetical protein BDR25DRAFT_328833 [Lindgomyces ingoldianus]